MTNPEGKPVVPLTNGFYNEQVVAREVAQGRIRPPEGQRTVLSTGGGATVTAANNGPVHLSETTCRSLAAVARAAYDKLTGGDPDLVVNSEALEELTFRMLAQVDTSQLR